MMIPQAIFFVHRIAKSVDGWHTRVISTDLNAYSVGGRSDPWPDEEEWSVFEMETSTQLRIHTAMTEEMDPIHPEEILSVYADEYAIQMAPQWQRSRLLQSQNFSYIVIDGTCDSFEVPFFLTTGFPTKPAQFSAQVKLHINGIEELPDVLEYEFLMHRFAERGDKYDRMLLDPPVLHPIEIPVEFYLPGTLCVDGREASCVYCVDERGIDRTAALSIHLSDATVAPVPGSRLIRRRRGPDGAVRECVVAVVQ